MNALDLLDDLADHSRVAAAPEGGIQVDEVNPLRALAGPIHGGFDRVAVARLRACSTLGQAHRLAVCDIDGGQQNQFGR